MSEHEKRDEIAESQENPLSEREMDVTRLLATGASNTEIARELTISPHTVKVHLRNIFEKLDVNSRTEASMLLIQRGWITVPGRDAVEPAIAEPETIETTTEESTSTESTETADNTPELAENRNDALSKNSTNSAARREAATPNKSTKNKSRSKATTQEPVVQSARDPLTESAQTGIEPGQIFGWQRLYLLAAVALSLFIFVPTLLSQSAPGPNLLSDVGSPEHTPLFESASRWRGRTPMLEPRSRLAVAQIGEHVYAIGGETIGGRTIATMEVFDLAINEWSSDAALPVPLANSAAATLDGRIYVAGGSYNTATLTELNSGNEPDSAISDKLFVYTPSTDKAATGVWTEAGLLPNPLAGAAMVSLDGSLYLIGGWDGSSMRDEIWRVEPSDDVTDPLPNWSLSDRMDVARAFTGAAVLNGDIYIVGGFDGSRELNFADKYMVADKLWVQLPPLSTPRGGLQLVSNETAVFAFGGGWAKPVNSHERFDPNTQLWSNFGSPVREEWRHFGAANHDSSIYVFGGWNGGYLNTHQQYETSLRRMLLPLIQSPASTD